MTERRQWLAGLKAGDKVIVEYTKPRQQRRLKLLKVFGRNKYSIQIETRDVLKLYWATTGAADQNTQTLLEPTPELMMEWREQGGNNG